ncbi:MAG: hypothetical protein J6K82_04215 [Alphaproteobacteria bacterium]|nr:hypothetical protein [Alphaproteobacteria bacterium]
MQKSRIFGSLTLSKLFIVLCAIFTFSTNNASGATACTFVSSVCAGSVQVYNYAMNCATTTNVCYSGGDYTFQIRQCATCSSGYTLGTVSTTMAGCNNVSYKVCTRPDTGTSCTSDSNCTSISPTEAGWRIASDGYQYQYGKGTCNTSTKKCQYGYYFRCDVGYYKTNPLAAYPVSCIKQITNISTGEFSFVNCSGCSRCDEFTGDGDSSNAYYGTSAAGSTMASNCYIPADEEFSDTTGTWSFTDDCYNGLILN